MNFEILFRVLMVGICAWMMLGDLSRFRAPARIRVRVRRDDHRN